MSDQDMLKSIYEHMMMMNKEMGAVQAQVDVLMKLFWVVMASSIGAAGASIWSLILHKRK